jgi:tetratricopeptide (TPR) repeat protein
VHPQRSSVSPWRLILGALALALLASPAPGCAAAAYNDKVHTRDGKETSGEIKADTIDGITIVGKEGQGGINIRVVVRVEYSDAPRAFVDGEDLRKVGRYDEAIPKYQSALGSPAREFWLKPSCKFGIAACQLEEGSDPAAAEAGFKELLKEHPQTRFRLEAMMGLGRALTANKKYDEAIAKFDELAREATLPARKMDEWALQAGLGKSKAYLEDLKFDKAAEEAEKVAASCPKQNTDIRVQAQAVVALAYVRQSQYDKAIDLLRTNIREIAGLVAKEMDTTPGDTRLRKTEAICFNTLGTAYFKKAVKGKSQDDYREALLAFLWNVVLYGNLFPTEHAVALDYAARCFKELKQDPRASELIQELKKSYPDYK